MKEELLERIREQYHRLERIREEDKKRWERIKELETKEIIKEYLSLTNMEGKSNFRRRYLTNDEMLEISLRGNMGYIDETNKIYVCLGKVKLSNNLKNNEYKRYMNIEKTSDSILIPLEKCEEFEKNNQVVFPEKIGINNYNEIQIEFIKTAVYEGQDKACKKILTKRKGE